LFAREDHLLVRRPERLLRQLGLHCLGRYRVGNVARKVGVADAVELRYEVGEIELDTEHAYVFFRICLSV
jgi:hypothetical protein